MPDEAADEFIRTADLNGDGKIDYIGTHMIKFKHIYTPGIQSTFLPFL